MEDTGKDISNQVLADLNATPCFSLAVCEKHRCHDVAQLCVWVRFPIENAFSRGNVVLTTTPQPNKRWGDSECVFGMFLRKCTSADAAPSMRSKEKGLIGLINKRDETPNFISSPCIIHEETLVSKLRNNENKWRSPSWTRSRRWPLLEFGFCSRLSHFETTCTESDVFYPRAQTAVSQPFQPWTLLRGKRETGWPVFIFDASLWLQ